MEIVKDPRNLLLGAIAVGWGGSTVYFFRHMKTLQEDIKKLNDLTPKIDNALGQHKNAFEEIKNVLKRMNDTHEDLLDSIEDMMDSHKEMDLYIQDSLRNIVKALSLHPCKILCGKKMKCGTQKMA